MVVCNGPRALAQVGVVEETATVFMSAQPPQAGASAADFDETAVSVGAWRHAAMPGPAKLMPVEPMTSAASEAAAANFEERCEVFMGFGRDGGDFVSPTITPVVGDSLAHFLSAVAHILRGPVRWPLAPGA